jgi:hypothetical protein
MSRPDLDDFAALWQSQPDLLDQKQIEAYAAAARRRGKLLGRLDYIVGSLLVAMTIAGAFISTNPLTIVAAIPLMLAITWMIWKRRQTRLMARTLNTSSPQAFLDSSLRIARANLRRGMIGLAALPLAVPVALAFKVSMRTGGGPQEIWDAFVVWTHTIRAPITVVLLLIMAGFSLRSRWKIQAEIRRLEALRRGYELEAEQEN